ncbi:AAA domain-containing protein [Zavarzinia compransoris]|uniref:Phospholipase D n=1 Tax=Zavarzinia compransoris TaxID=1264899 RepID=A0A317DTS9_9PROT|nr:AAA domain-containing protein [Zavarzinia compransoris]PWR17774.1 hypothetical protein DKG75_21765 [Zavarzinia compransoris]TDP49303.1 phospholipase D-like protein [Zavarzinia compransoris]
MVKADLSVLRYWRAAVADSAAGEACLTPKALGEFQALSRAEAESGRLSRDTIEVLFAGVPKNQSRVAVSYRPLHVRRRVSHARSRGDGLPLEVAPVVTEAAVTRAGLIIPMRSVIARDILDPLPRGAFSIGSVADLDRFLTARPFPAGEGRDDLWPRHQAYWRQLMAEAGGNWPEADDDYQAVGWGLIRPAADNAQTVKQILALSDVLIREQPAAPLLANFARSTPRPLEPALAGPFPLAERLGHANGDFPLADHQREVLAHLARAGDGEILAVNGPPGTGKTTMLLSAIAGEWVRAALEGGEPPLIVAASTNNQAVTNIIDAFGKDFGRGEGPFAGRWLPEIQSFGLFLASKSREGEAAAKYQTERFFDKLETADYLARARAAYLRAARAAFPGLEPLDVPAAIDALHGLMREEQRTLAEADATHGAMVQIEAAIRQDLGEAPEAALAERQAARTQAEAEGAAAAALLHKWEGWLASEPLLQSLFAFLPPVARKRGLRARLFLREAGADEAVLAETRADAMEARLKNQLRDRAEKQREAAERHQRAMNALAARDARSAAWRALAQRLAGESGDVPGVVALDRLADCRLRFRLFLLATHYWEGRWLLAMEEALPALQRQQQTGRGANDRAMVEPQWRRRMMLTPCAVSTFATLPGKMTCRDDRSGSFRTEYLFNHIDLLIVDEAGQVLPEVAAPSFALAKRALVIGDTQQIEPISSLPLAVDIGNLTEAGLLSHAGDRAALERVEALGLTSRSGSTMRLAQSACRFQPYPRLDRGLYLFEHRRCYDEIIGFCNDLCYKGTLLPRRGAAVGTMLPPMGYLHVDGMAAAAGGSRFNALEAHTIAAWLAAEGEGLKQRYGRRLEDIVGIVTPFGRQVREIAKACAEAGIDVGRQGMTIGTVHALQGAERPVVIFSPVYSKHADGGFIDQSPSMLNVAVSRAKDAFLVFGDMDTLAAAPPGSPRAVLARFLFAEEANGLAFQVPPRPDLSQGQRTVEMLRDAAEHDAFLLQELAAARRKFCIVSPWVNVDTMARAGTTPAIAQARARGVEVEIFADPVLIRDRNKPGQDKFAEAQAALAKLGVPLHAVRQLHSKLVWADGALLAVGSFNWLSALRSGDYARHETSVVYRGSHLGAEIGLLEGSLKPRIGRDG